MGQGYWTKRNGQLALAGIKFWRADWLTLTDYVAGDGVHDKTNGNAYICILEHQADPTTEPGVGVNWTTYWNILVDGGNGTVYIDVAQTDHGFSVGDYIRPDPTNPGDYVLAQADNATDATGVGFVANIIDANNFKLVQTGYVTDDESPGSVPTEEAGTVLYLSPTSAGGYTTTRPSTNGQYIKPIAIVTISAQAMWVLSDFAVPFSGGSGGGVQSVNDDGLGFFLVDNTDPANPIGSIDVTAIANDGGFITALTNNSAFQTAVNSFVTGGNPLTTKGDLYTFDTANARLPVGSNGQILSVDNTTPTGLRWIANFGGGGSGTKLNISTATRTATSGNTTLDTFLIPGGILGTNNALRLKLFGVVANSSNSSNPPSLEITYGGNSIGVLNLFGLSNTPVDVEVLIVADTVTGQQKATAYAISATDSAGTGASFTEVKAVINTDSTIGQNLVIIGSGDVSFTSSVSYQGYILEKITAGASQIGQYFPIGSTHDTNSSSDPTVFTPNALVYDSVNDVIYIANMDTTSKWVKDIVSGIYIPATTTIQFPVVSNVQALMMDGNNPLLYYNPGGNGSNFVPTFVTYDPSLTGLSTDSYTYGSSSGDITAGGLFKDSTNYYWFYSSTVSFSQMVCKSEQIGGGTTFSTISLATTPFRIVASFFVSTGTTAFDGYVIGDDGTMRHWSIDFVGGTFTENSSISIVLPPFGAAQLLKDIFSKTGTDKLYSLYGTVSGNIQAMILYPNSLSVFPTSVSGSVTTNFHSQISWWATFISLIVPTP